MTLSPFHPAVGAWFRDTFAEPTECQRLAWPAIRSGTHTVIAAPTGAGKTLAAFLCAIDALLREGIDAGYLEDQIHTLYVSPLKALSNDVEKNLQLPLQGIRDQLLLHGTADVDVRVAVRTGDTPPGERQRMRRVPPHILVTTPESLYLLLTSESGRNALATVKTVIVDEIHAVAANKRGAHLALSLQRLKTLTAGPPTLIGLSATQKPISTIADFLIGNDREPRRIVDVGHTRERDLALVLTGSPLEAVMSGEAWEEVYGTLADLVRRHRSTLIFVNTRRLAERVARHLAERVGEDRVTAHHGSLAREHRLDAEQRLKKGQLSALVATASLELGIDIGDVDLVCQLGSPRGIATLLQRVGRSGHSVGAIPKGRLFPTTRDDLVECAALLDAVDRGELEQIQISEQPLDVLAQQIVAEVANREWDQEALYTLYRGAWPYRCLERARFDQVVDMLANGFSTRRGRRGAYLYLDAVQRRLRGRRAARLTALTNGGTIPDQFDYDVVLEPEDLFIGTLNEDFAFESVPGDIFQLGNTSYRVLGVERSVVRVEDAHGMPPNIPFWIGEAPGRSDELSRAVSRLRAEFARRWRDDRGGLEPWLREMGLSVPAADQLIEYLGSACLALGLLPTQDTVVLERFFDESGDTHLVVHSPFGSRLNRAWGLALRKRFCRRFNFELQAAALEDSIVLSLSASHSFPLAEVKEYLSADSVRQVLVQALLDAPMFNARWRWNATVALAVRRNRNGKRVAPQLQRMDAEDLVAVVFPDQLACLENIAGEREVPDHPLVDQTIHDCLTEAMDITGLEQLLRRLAADQVKLETCELALPSPLAQEVLTARPYAFLDDAPAEERRTRAVQARGYLDPQTAADLGRLDPEAVEQVRREVWPEPRDADELHDAMLLLGGLTEAESGREGNHWQGWFGTLAAERRATLLELPAGGRVWVAAERLNQWRQLHPAALCRDAVAAVTTPAFAAADPESALRELVRSRLEGLGPVTALTLSYDLEAPLPAVHAALLELETEGFAMRGCFVADLDEQWCDRRLLARINRYTVKRLRREIEPVSAADYVRFLCEWHGLSRSQQRAGEQSLRSAIEQLEGFAAPAAAWERSLLPLRVADYEAGMLDRLCLSGQVQWLRSAGEAAKTAALSRSTAITLAPRQRLACWRRPPPDASTLSDDARRLQAVLAERGALFFDEARSRSGLDEREAALALREMVARGMLHCDGFEGLRALLRRAPARRFDGVGRWGMVPAVEQGQGPRVTAVAWALLRRYGVVFRKVLEREATGLPAWREILSTLRRLEARGEVRGGRFVAGFSGEQFALPEAVGLLREVRRRRADGELVTISAADPLNLLGIVLAGTRVPARPGNRIVLRDGVPVAVEIDKSVSYLKEFDHHLQWNIRNAMAGVVAPSQSSH